MGYPETRSKSRGIFANIQSEIALKFHLQILASQFTGELIVLPVSGSKIPPPKDFKPCGAIAMEIMCGKERQCRRY